MKQIHIDICCGARCSMMGALHLLEKVEDLKNEIEELDSIVPQGSITVSPVPCTQECKSKENLAPIVIINGEKIYNASAPKVMEKIMEGTK